MNINDKVIVITGAASGIGRATACKFAYEGARVVVADLNEVGGVETVHLIKKAGGEAAYIKTDVTNVQDVEKAVDFAVETYGSIDIMFNNAGTGGRAPLLEHDPEMYDRVIKVNQYGVYYGILAAARKMKELGIQGVIVNNGSTFGFLASNQGIIGYHTSKAAVKMMTQCAAIELASYGIRVVGIAPGFVDTPISKRPKDRATGKHMRNELIHPEAIADAVYLLCQNGANVINGSTVMLDDGYAVFK
ncbi:SDR family NAD(P)-dependent oxidoreductase [Bacillus massiliigorillae]|uniref:SDR family NAD(P)-dependent oxidoreductase n=1 Tax=Bacillus massiliigorillae TaxID=1243664 RepID=UPI0003A2D47A|nr:SDR family oxidoreductase [Bacillus massiliigorillae]